MGLLRYLLAHPLTRGMDLDDPRTTELRREIILEKDFLRKIYAQWYRWISERLPSVQGPVLEIGAGACCPREPIPGLTRSEVFFLPHVDCVLDGQQLPIASNSLRAVVMTDVFHHLPSPRLFLREATRCIKPGGAIVMIEPWVTTWSRWVYSRLHYEPFVPEDEEWASTTASTGPLSTANEALAWIVFQRDRYIFEHEFPTWKVTDIEPVMPFTYLLSGGVSTRSLMPGWSFGFWLRIESLLGSQMDRWGMFAIIVVNNQNPGADPQV